MIWVSRVRVERGSYSVYVESCVFICFVFERGFVGVCCIYIEYGRLVYKCGGGEGSGRFS